MAQAAPLPEGFAAAPCRPGECLCCNNVPVRGPNDEYLCDGGDYGLPAAVRANWQIDGLEPEDTIAHYDTIDGRTIVTPSNKLCIYAPRFAAIRQVTDLRAYERYVQLEGAVQQVAPVKIDESEEAAMSLAELEPSTHRTKAPPSLLRERALASELERQRRLAATIATLAPYANVQLVRTGELIGEDRVKIARASLAAITWAGDQAAQVVFGVKRAQAEVAVQSVGTIYHLEKPNNPRLRLVKLASTGAAQPGDEVEFTLRFDNVGDRLIGNVTIVDSLTTRLEYVEGSQESSIEARFSAEPNDAGSVTLRWEIVEPVPAGEGGVLQFRARVR